VNIGVSAGGKVIRCKRLISWGYNYSLHVRKIEKITLSRRIRKTLAIDWMG
jgi:hypothetical protein